MSLEGLWGCDRGSHERGEVGLLRVYSSVVRLWRPLVGAWEAYQSLLHAARLSCVVCCVLY